MNDHAAKAVPSRREFHAAVALLAAAPLAAFAADEKPPPTRSPARPTDWSPRRRRATAHALPPSSSRKSRSRCAAAWHAPKR